MDINLLLITLGSLSGIFVNIFMKIINNVVLKWFIKCIEYKSPSTVSLIDELLKNHTSYITDDNKPQEGWYSYNFCLFIKSTTKQGQMTFANYYVYSYSFQNIIHTIGLTDKGKGKDIIDIYQFTGNISYDSRPWKIPICINNYTAYKWQQDVIENLYKHKIVFLSGPSGCGKSFTGRLFSTQFRNIKLIEGCTVLSQHFHIHSITAKMGNNILIILNEIDEGFKFSLQNKEKHYGSFYGETKEKMNGFFDYARDLNIYLLLSSNIPLNELQKIYPTYMNNHRIPFKYQVEDTHNKLD